MNGQTPTPEMTCERCGEECAMPDGAEPTPYCCGCAHDVIDELRAELAEARKRIEELEKQIEHMGYADDLSNDFE